MIHLINKTITKMGLELQSRRAQVVFTLSAVGAYILAFIPLYSWAGTEATAISIFPVIAAAWFFGRRMGLIVGLLSIPLNTLLLNLVGEEPGGLGVVIHSGGGVGTIIILLIGMVVGRLRDLGHQLKRQLAEREQMAVSLHKREEPPNASNVFWRKL